MMKAEATAENRPAWYLVSIYSLKLEVRLTKIRVVFKSSSYFLRNSLSNSSATLR